MAYGPVGLVQPPVRQGPTEAHRLLRALQPADQYKYDNHFIDCQPGNGKVKIKEPKQQLKVAVDKLAPFLQ